MRLRSKALADRFPRAVGVAAAIEPGAPEAARVGIASEAAIDEEVGHRRSPHPAMATLSSISTAAPWGRAATPIAERACRPAFAKDVVEDAARAIDHLRLLPKVGARRDKAGDFEKLFDPVKAAERGFDHSERIERADASRFYALLQRHGFAKPPQAGDLAVDAR